MKFYEFLALCDKFSDWKRKVFWNLVIVDILYILLIVVNLSVVLFAGFTMWYLMNVFAAICIAVFWKQARDNINELNMNRSEDR